MNNEKPVKQDSFEDFIDIEFEDFNVPSTSTSGGITKQQHQIDEPAAVMQVKNDLHGASETNEHDSTIVNEKEQTLETTTATGNVEDELQRSLEETSRKNVLSNSMELARENLLLISSGSTSNQEDNDSFVSARSNVTLTDGDTENTSFVTATDRLTPVNDGISVSIPDLPKTSSPRGSSSNLSHAHGSTDDLSRTRGSTKDLSRARASSSDLSSRPLGAETKRLSGSKFEIQFIDENTNKVMSRESLNPQFEASAVVKNKKVGKETTV